MHSLHLVSCSPEETQELGHAIAQELQAGDLLFLSGDLGTGKTCLTQGLASGLGVVDQARSPSFVFMVEYRGRLPLYHVDLFRINDPRETLNLGLEDILDGTGICVIEWAEKSLSTLPKEHLLIKIRYRKKANERKLSLTGCGHRYQTIIKCIETNFLMKTRNS